MGCCSSGTQGPARTLVQYEGSSMPFSNVTSLEALKKSISSSHPDIKSPIVLTSTEGVPYTEDTYSKAVRQTSELKVLLKVLKPHEFKDAAWLPIAESVFKIQGKDGKLRGTGFLLNKNYALTSSDVLKSTEIANLQCVFDLPKPQKVDLDGGFAVNVNTGANEGLVILKLAQAMVDKSGVLLTANEAHVEGESAILLYYSTKMPVLRAMEDGNIQKFDKTRIQYSKTAEAGANGAPLFDGKKRLIGVYIGGTPPIVLNSTSVVQTLQSLITQQSLGDREKAAVSEVLQSAGINDTEDQMLLASGSAEKVQRVPEPQAEQLESFDLSNEVSSSDPLFAYIVDFAKDAVSMLDGSGYRMKIISLQHRLIPGISCVMTPFGLVLTGPNSESRQKAYLMTDSGIEEMANLSHEHRYHTSVWYRNEVLVISGLISRNVEKLTDVRGAWEPAGSLPERRAYAPALVYTNIVYLFGGISGEGSPALSTILAGSGDTWTQLSYEIPLALKGFGVILLSEQHKVVLFGGFTATNEGNDRVWELTLGQGTVDPKGTFKFQGNLHCCQPVIFSNQMAFAASDSGAIFSYHTGKGTFRLVYNEATSSV